LEKQILSAASKERCSGGNLLGWYRCFLVATYGCSRVRRFSPLSHLVISRGKSQDEVYGVYAEIHKQDQ
jgi:hypothetical protein